MDSACRPAQNPAEMAGNRARADDDIAIVGLSLLVGDGTKPLR